MLSSTLWRLDALSSSMRWIDVAFEIDISGCLRLILCTIGPSRISQFIPQECFGATEVKFITPINSLRIFWCKRLCNFS